MISSSLLYYSTLMYVISYAEVCQKTVRAYFISCVLIQVFVPYNIPYQYLYALKHHLDRGHVLPRTPPQ